MNLKKLIKLICAGAIVGACLLATGCEGGYVKFEAGSSDNGGNNNGGGNNNSGTNTTVPQQTLPTGAGNEGLSINDAGQVVSNQSSVDFSDYATGAYSIKVSNNTSKRLVAFIGLPREESLISGVPAMRTNFGLKLNTELFAHSSDFVLFFVTEEDYVANKETLSNLDNKPFTRIYAYYNKNAVNNVVYPISAFMGGTCSITLNNANCPYNVELRRDGINGETIGYAIHDSVNTVFKVNADNYYIFPVYRKFDSNINEIVTVYPKKDNGRAVTERFSLGPSKTDVALNSSDWIKNVEFSPSAAYIEIVNNSTNGIEFCDGAKSTPIATSTGETFINAGDRRKFVVKMECNSSSITENPTFAEWTEYAQYNVGSADIGRVYITTNSMTDSGTDFKFYAGKKYVIKIRDNPNTSSSQEIVVDLSWKTETPVDVSSDLTDTVSEYKTYL